jgi:hypothetical protein
MEILTSKKSQNLDPLANTSKQNFRPKYASLSKKFWCKKLTRGALQKYKRYIYAV